MHLVLYVTRADGGWGWVGGGREEGVRQELGVSSCGRERRREKEKNFQLSGVFNDYILRIIAYSGMV